MSIGINTNAEALGAVRHLSKTTQVVSTSMERLSSGKRINSAADDAAGLAIVTNLSRQINGTDQAISNAREGVSMTEVMDAALGEVSDILQRARQLAVYSSNGTLSAADRSALDTEYQNLVGATGEVNRILSTTAFNGTTLLDDQGGTGSVVFQVGWSTGDTITIGTKEFGAGGADDLLATIGDIGTDAATSVLELATLDTAIDAVVSYRAELGANQNRLESTISNLESLSEKTKVARGRIEDADFAAESTNLARGQVLQQAGMGMLSRANQSAQQVMQLLRQ